MPSRPGEVKEGGGSLFRFLRLPLTKAVTVVSYPKNYFPTKLVYGNTDHAALRLITCGGPFDYATGQYVDNIVVFASLVGSH